MRRRDQDRDDRLLAEFFADVHARDHTPSFRRLARPRPGGRAASGRRLAGAVLGVLLVAVALAWLTPWLRSPDGGALSEEEQLALAVELSSPTSWRGPLDFLLETPSREILTRPPSFDLTTLKIPPPAGAEEKQP